MKTLSNNFVVDSAKLESVKQEEVERQQDVSGKKRVRQILGERVLKDDVVLNAIEDVFNRMEAK